MSWRDRRASLALCSCAIWSISWRMTPSVTASFLSAAVARWSSSRRAVGSLRSSEHTSPCDVISGVESDSLLVAWRRRDDDVYVWTHASSTNDDHGNKTAKNKEPPMLTISATNSHYTHTISPPHVLVLAHVQNLCKYKQSNKQWTNKRSVSACHVSPIQIYPIKI